MNALQTAQTQETFQDKWNNATKKKKYQSTMHHIYEGQGEEKAEVEERKVVMEERTKSIEQEQKFMFMYTSGLDDKVKAYMELCRDQVLAMLWAA